MGFSISDMIYSDNPNRRARAIQLKSDIESFYQELKGEEKSKQVPFRSN